MMASDRFERASFWALVTALVAGITLFGYTIRPVLSATYFGTALIVLAGTYAVLVTLIAGWYLTLKVCGK